MHFDLKEILPQIGYIGIFLVVFAESGLLIGFFLPGDSLLFVAGFLASQGVFNIALLALLTFMAAVTGDSVGYEFGKKVGPKLYSKPDSKFFKKEHLEKAKGFYEKHGKKTIIMARFIPFVRTFAPIVAGIANMKYREFIIFNMIGGFIWAVGVTLFGYFLGQQIEDADKYLLPIIAGIILLSVLPGILHVLKEKAHSKKNLKG